ncbi:ecdysone receptor-like [Mercenaria mercenaria]|uniref:ecdysone receptor-like n=1 Tax=Mercenaria mercenaria TaxID=6596 RepID=UPI00234F5683|nr:ecdysone receptor-like [Mercenaria mercenaria]
MSTPQNTAEPTSSILPFSINCPKNTDTVTTVSNDHDTHVQKDTQNFVMGQTAVEAMDLSTGATGTSKQIPEAMEAEFVDIDKDVNGGKSSYEIAAEALCLMKSGGLASLSNKQESAIKENVQTLVNLSNSEARYAEAICSTSGNKLVPNHRANEGDPLTINSRTENLPQTAVNVVNNGPQAQEYCVPNSTNQSTTSVSSETRSLSILSNVSLPSTPVQSSAAALATSGQPVKYVIVPESALLSTVKPGEIVSVPGTPYYFMMPKEKQPATKVISIPGLPGFSQGCLPQKGNTSVFTVSKSAVVTSVPVNFSKSATASDQQPINKGNFQPLALNAKSFARKRSSMKRHESLKFPPCIICEGEASGFHYGCNTCEACKNFFRRCLLRKSDTPFVCHSGKTCEISFKKNKNNCSACRLDKCLEMGMAKEKCKMGRYTALMRTETIKKVRKLEGKDEDNSDTSSADSPGPSSSQQDEMSQPDEAMPEIENLENRDICGAMISKQIYSASHEKQEIESKTEYNEELVEYLVSAMEGIKPWGENLVTEESRKALIKEHYEKYTAKVETFGKLSDVSMQEYQVLLKKFGIDIDGHWESFKQWSFDWETVIGRYCTFAKCIPEFCSLSYDDQACLLKATHFDFFVIVLHQGYIPEYGVFLEVNGVPFHIEEAANKFFSRDLVVSMVDMMSRLQKMNLSKSEMALLISVITMSSDQCKLENSRLVEDTQLRLIDLLLKESCKIHGQAAGRKRLTSFIDVMTKMREVSNIYYKEYRALCKDDLIKEAVPNLDCVLPDEH